MILMTQGAWRSWDVYFLKIADAVREKSKDPSSQIGAVIVNGDNAIVSTGFNGFPRGIDETNPNRWERPIKYDYVEHAERNAIYNAARQGVATKGCTLYIVGFGGNGVKCVPCINCTKGTIQAGITRVVGYYEKEAPEHWVQELLFAESLLKEAGVQMTMYDKEFNIP